MIRRRIAGVPLVSGVVVALAIVCVLGTACGSEPKPKALDHAGAPVRETASNAIAGERGTRADNVHAGQGGAPRPSGSSEDEQAGARIASDSRPSASANGEPDPNPVGSPVAAANDGFDLESLLEDRPLVIATTAVGLLVVIAVVCIGWMSFRRKSGVVEPSGRAVQGGGPRPETVSHRPVDEPNPRSAVALQPPDVTGSRVSGYRDDGMDIAELAADIEHLRRRVERLESLEHRVNEIDGVVASLYSSDGLAGAVKARELVEPREVPVFILEEPGASLTPVSENWVRQLAFPARVSDCLALVRERGLNGVLANKSKNKMPGTLERAAPGPQAAFILVDLEAPGDKFLALPNRPRLGEAQDYHTYYLDYYDCASPSSGNLIVQSAAIVRESGGEWTIETRGVLSVEQ